LTFFILSHPFEIVKLNNRTFQPSQGLG